MKYFFIEVSEEGIVFCDNLPCDCWLSEDKACENCPIVILRNLKQQGKS